MSCFLRLACFSLLLLNAACSTVIEGRSQKISVDSYPTGAECAVKDNDIILARVHTPGIATIEKSKNDILVECSKDGYITNAKRNRSDVAITSIGNMAMGQWSFLGNMVDSASGASHKYDSRVFIGLNPLPPVALAPNTQDEPKTTASAEVTPVSTSDLSNLDPNSNLAQTLAKLLGAQKVIVTQQPLNEVLQTLASQQALASEATLDNNATLVAHLSSPTIMHSAE